MGIYFAFVLFALPTSDEQSFCSSLSVTEALWWSYITLFAFVLFSLLSPSSSLLVAGSISVLIQPKSHCSNNLMKGNVHCPESRQVSSFLLQDLFFSMDSLVKIWVNELFRVWHWMTLHPYSSVLRLYNSVLICFCLSLNIFKLWRHSQPNLLQ